MTNPNDPPYTSVDNVSVCGLTTRELFAAMAMQGFAACQGVFEEWGDLKHAVESVRLADALIAELAKKTT